MLSEYHLGPSLAALKHILLADMTHSWLAEILHDLWNPPSQNSFTLYTDQSRTPESQLTGISEG